MFSFENTDTGGYLCYSHNFWPLSTFPADSDNVLI
jgi:hypothetical protein